MKELQVLKALYRATGGNVSGSATTNAVAETAGLSHREVTGALQDLITAGYVEHADDGVRLTPAGARRVKYGEA